MKKAKSFFIGELKKEKYHLLEDAEIFLTNHDGIVLFYTGDKEKASLKGLGPLVSGAWHASHELTKFIKNSDQEDDFRWSFDTSSMGLHALPLHVKNKVYFLGVIYSGVTSPAPMKTLLRFLSTSVKEFLEKNIEEARTINEEVLFKNITDDEINQMFSSLGI